MRGTRCSNAGLTLPQLAVVLAFVAMAAVAVVTNYHRHALAQRRTVTIQRMTRIIDALDKYGVDSCGVFPTARQGGLKALVVKPTEGVVPNNWRGPYLEHESDLVDGWGAPFRYARPGGGDPPRPFDLWSFGRDGRQDGTAEDADITSWQRQSQLP
jgi:general secretion pathway protein G